jgi:hypothetical protein
MICLEKWKWMVGKDENAIEDGFYDEPDGHGIFF